MTRKRFIKLLMGREDFTPREARQAARELLGGGCASYGELWRYLEELPEDGERLLGIIKYIMKGEM